MNMHHHLPIRWGHPVWIRFVHHRSEMLSGVRPAMQAEWNRVWPFVNHRCPVCQRGRLDLHKHGYLCLLPACSAKFQEVEEYIDFLPWRAINLYLLPGQQFPASLCPPPRKLPETYPVHI